MKKILIVGAFDRYNYGDNIMPVLLKMYINKHHPKVSEKFSFLYSGITSSDLSKYGVEKTLPISEAVREKDLHGVVCVGGEVLCSSSSTLFLHADHSTLSRKIVKFLKKIRLTILADLGCRFFYRLPWEYPYIPNMRYNGVKVVFNTVGGRVSDRSISQKIYGVRGRLASSDYLSVRDTRTEKALRNFSSPVLYPDSAMIMSDLVDDALFRVKVGNGFIDEVAGLRKYIVFQAAPHKVLAKPQEVVILLENLERELGVKVVLCPIGYAKGHDDRAFLMELQSISGNKFNYYDELSVWKIMYLIKSSSIFIGTSLHGVITAMSYGVPHIGINKKIAKLDSFLNDWSVPPFNECYDIENILPFALDALDFPVSELKENAKRLKSLVSDNNDNLLRSLGVIN